MNVSVFIGLMVPFVGTALGSMLVLFMKNEMNRSLQRALTGFAAGVMVSASFWSLLIPAVEQATENVGKKAVDGIVELKNRQTNEQIELSIDELIQKLI